MIALLVVLYRRAKPITRTLGIIFTIYGALSLVAVLIVRNIVLPRIAPSDLPAEVQTFIPQLARDVMSPLQMF
ncbi:MAG: hypothetical protein M1419_09465, partial [Bacteroidetes bacterium]|nr:hypothetical protein [Bacteroidota bacterium]